MITFILNNLIVNSDKPEGISLLDFIRYEMDLTGTKIGCREGDCGACTVLEGTLNNGKIDYKSIVSCLTPLLNVQGKHIVTVEGINMQHLSPVQEAIITNSGTQCGFCTPGFVVSFTSHCLSKEKSDNKSAIASISGNICRCTGYKSIEKAAFEISELLKNKDIDDPVKWLVQNKFLPDYFLTIPKRLAELKNNISISNYADTIIAGGTDLMVQKPDELAEDNIISVYEKKDLKGILIEEGVCTIGAATTASEIAFSKEINRSVPGIPEFFKLISSEPIRNMGTVGGNIVNASPIGDLTILLLALNAELLIHAEDDERKVPLNEFYHGYKKTGLKKGEYIKNVAFPVPLKPFHFNFEKVSKRAHLDIASVNSAIQVILDDGKIKECYLSAGGVSPIPLFLKKSTSFLLGKSLTPKIILQANEIMQEEITPIGDIRGSMEYKRLLLRQLFFAHFLKLFPERISPVDLFILK
jgi:xanthine dehydrogenase small subunit